MNLRSVPLPRGSQKGLDVVSIPREMKPLHLYLVGPAPGVVARTANSSAAINLRTRTWASRNSGTYFADVLFVKLQAWQIWCDKKNRRLTRESSYSSSSLLVPLQNATPEVPADTHRDADPCF